MQFPKRTINLHIRLEHRFVRRIDSIYLWSFPLLSLPQKLRFETLYDSIFIINSIFYTDKLPNKSLPSNIGFLLLLEDFVIALCNLSPHDGQGGGEETMIYVFFSKICLYILSRYFSRSISFLLFGVVSNPGLKL